MLYLVYNVVLEKNKHTKKSKFFVLHLLINAYYKKYNIYYYIILL